MSFNEWKIKLKPVGVLLLCYFLVPIWVETLLGTHNALFRNVSFSVLVQAGLGAAALYKLFELENAFSAELAAWFGQKGRHQAKTIELSGKICSAAKVVAAVMLMLPPLGDIFRSGGAVSLLKFALLGYAVYSAYVIWDLLEPFLKYTAPGEEFQDESRFLPPPPPPPPARRCPKCGQTIDGLMAVCAFCKNPLKRG